MSLILAVQTYPGANAAVQRHFPHYEKAGADKIIGITTTDGDCFWPGEHSYRIGRNSYINGDHLCRRLIETIEKMLEQETFTTLCVIEYDTIFLRPIPRDLPSGLVMNITGGPQAGRKGTYFFHNPWIMDADTALQVALLGRKMLEEGDYENGSPDCFIGWLAEKNNIPVCEFLRTWTLNTIEEKDVPRAREAIAMGAHAIHGIKTKKILDAILL